MKIIEYPNKLDIIIEKLNKYTTNIIIVGGFVRDSLLNISSNDIDIELYGIENLSILENILKEYGEVNNVGKNFGVCKLTFQDLEIDFSLPRTDNKIANGHTGFEIIVNPNLDFETASKRRDFTINAIGYDILNNKLLDPHKGQLDLKSKTLKMVDKSTFKEDPLRVLRAVGFCARFEFNMDVKLFQTCQDMVKQNLLDELPKERIFQEIKKLLLKAKKPSIGFKLLEELGVKLFKIDDEKLVNIDKYAKEKTKNTTTDMSIFLSILYKNIDLEIDKITNSKTLLNNVNSLLHVEKYFTNNTKTISYNIAKNINLIMLDSYLKTLSINKNLQYLKPKTHGKDLIMLNLKPSKIFSNILQDIYTKQLSLHYN